MKWALLGAGVGLGAVLFIVAAIHAERDFTDLSQMGTGNQGFGDQGFGDLDWKPLQRSPWDT